MQSFDTKDSNTLESFDRKFENFDIISTKDSELEQSGNDFVESSDRKIEDFDTFSTKDSEVEQADTDFVESSDRKFEGFDTKDSEMEQSDDEVAQSSDRKFESFESKDTKVDGRSKPRTRKQIDAYKRNFGAGKVIERKIYELDKRVQHLQQFLLNICSNQLQLTDLI
jgi:hypothetical protein